MSANAQYASNAKSFNGSIATTKVNDRANGTSANLVSLVAAGANGTRIDRIGFSAVGSTTAAAAILLYKGTSAGAAVYFDEIPINPQTVGNASAAWQADYTKTLVLANGETLYAALTVSPGVAINYTSKLAGDF